ncbi:DUF2726 domain-containing protein [Vibrio nigripulchritudo]|uniref:DUF2726 domain-containing protein n=1 Tax=Vibrio nigripulchritudo TaxID=28173 RepID=UPI002493A158|nr:DUF2726 domain-containing protein [Vibrio nigripulchritudo]BDU37148.1 hypothetical protein TUMSATVNIG2_16170 [Vibrio nigripulchritudo]BDU42860.1 hypothetical protein TUMSATVNIG3_16580 [Vibrio nigripulchritudo]
MTTLQIILILAFFFILLALSAGKKRKGASASGSKYQYQPKKYLTTKAETSFYHALNNAVGDKYRVFSKVRIADVIAPKKGLYNKKEWRIAFNQISAKHFDYVLCCPKTLEILYTVELDDASHQKPSRIKRDQLIEHACESAGVKLIRVPVSSGYNPENIASLFDETTPEAAASFA